jgi:two-component system NtrC family sensor kinase
MNESNALRRKAEAALLASETAAVARDSASARLIHELQVHQVELEMQNDELVAAQLTAQQRIEQIESLNRQLAQAQSLLLQSEKMAAIGQLAAGVAHEINNPIGFVDSNLVTLREYIDELLEVVAQSEKCVAQCSGSPQQAALKLLLGEKDMAFIRQDVGQLLAESLDGTARVRRIVQNLKDFSHVSEEAWQWADLHQGLEKAVALVWHEIKYKADLVRAYGELPLVCCMAGQINQVLMNLLMNASQAIATRGTITLASGLVAPAEGRPESVWIEVRDTGGGIAAEHLTRVFDPFFTTKPVGKGTGLGLSLSWSIVQKHHGTLIVRSQVGEGSIFRLTLPIAQPDTPKVGAGNTASNPPGVHQPIP